MPNYDPPDEGIPPNVPRSATSTPRMSRCPRCGRPDTEIVRDALGHLLLACEFCGYRFTEGDPRFASSPR